MACTTGHKKQCPFFNQLTLPRATETVIIFRKLTDCYEMQQVNMEENGKQPADTTVFNHFTAMVSLENNQCK